MVAPPHVRLNIRNVFRDKGLANGNTDLMGGFTYTQRVERTDADMKLAMLFDILSALIALGAAAVWLATPPKATKSRVRRTHMFKSRAITRTVGH
jgi:hypothetical protein